MNKEALIIVILILALVAVLAGCGAKPLTLDYEHNTVEPFAIQSGTLIMSEGTVFEGYLTVEGGNDAISFYIEDPQGNKVLDIDVQGRHDFHYRAKAEGDHTFYCDNSSWPTGKEVCIYYHFSTGGG